MEIIASFVPEPGVDPRTQVATPPVGATMVEVRVDLLPAGCAMEDVIAASPLPVVATLRSQAEGGRGPNESGERRGVLARLAALPIALIDLEAVRDAELLDREVPAGRCVLSMHFTAGPPPDLEARTGELLARGTRLVKIVPEAQSLADLLAVLRLQRGLERGRASERRGLVFAMGEAGRASRLVGPLLGAPVAFAAWSEQRAAAPGQYTPAELNALIGHLSGRPRRVFAVVGRPVGGSLSPRMHAAAFRALGLPNLFLPIDVTEAVELDRIIAPQGLSCLDDLALPLGGLAVTMPLKGDAMRRCSIVAPRAERAGAVNTVIPRPGKTLGDCTDIDGVTAVLNELGADPAGARALVLGTGGAARAAVVALDLAGAEVAIAGRDAESTARVAERLGVAAASVAESASADILVNATPAGRDGTDDAMLTRLAMREGAAVVDLPYGPVPTALEVLAGNAGWRYASGREVLLFQGISQFAAMNQVAPPIRAMAAALGLEDIQ